MKVNKKLLIVTPWGNPFAWKEVTYELSLGGREVVNSSYTTTAVFQDLAEEMLNSHEISSYHIFILAADTLWSGEGYGEGFTYSQLIQSVRDNLSDVMRRYGVRADTSSLILLPGLGTFESKLLGKALTFTASDRTKSALDYRLLSLLYLFREFMDEVRQGDEVELWLDITHGVNYMPVLTYSNLQMLATWLSLWLGREVRLKVFQASPVIPPGKDTSRITLLRDFTIAPRLHSERELSELLKAARDDQVYKLSRYFDVVDRQLRGMLSRNWDSKYRAYSSYLKEVVSSYLFMRNWLLLPGIFSHHWDLLAPEKIESLIRELLNDLISMYMMDEMFKFTESDTHLYVIRRHNLKESIAELISLLVGVRLLSIKINWLVKELGTEDEGVLYFEAEHLPELYSHEEVQFINPSLAMREMALSEPGRVKMELEEFTPRAEEGVEYRLTEVLQSNREAKGERKLKISADLVPRNFLAHGGLEYNRTFAKFRGGKWLLRFAFNSPEERETINRYLLSRI